MNLEESTQSNRRSKAIDFGLEPLKALLDLSNVEEINVNKVNEAFVNYNNKPKEKVSIDFDHRKMTGLTTALANYNNQKIDRSNPSITTTLPTGERCQIVIPPACDSDNFGLSIRKPSKLMFSIDDFEAQGAFNDVVIEDEKESETDKELLSLYKAKDFNAFLKLAVPCKKNIILSGGTGAGKTTFLKGLVQEVPTDERIVSIEDNRELVVKNEDYLPLLFTKDGEGVSKHTAEDCVKWSLRLNPDRLLMSELTGLEAQAFLRAVKSGHPGSLTTVHADNCNEALDNIVMMIQNNSLRPPPIDQIRDTLKRTINIVIQYSKIGFNRVVPEIYFDLYEKDRGRL